MEGYTMKRFSVAIAALVASVGIVLATANIPYFTGPQEASQLFSYLNTLINNINSGSFQSSVQPFTNFRNVLDNGNMAVSQRGTGTTTCAVASAAIASTNYNADRWGCIAN